MGIDVLFGTIETTSIGEDGKITSKIVRKRGGAVYDTKVRYTDVTKPKTRGDILQSFINFIDSVDIYDQPVSFRIRPNTTGGWTVEREWVE